MPRKSTPEAREPDSHAVTCLFHIGLPKTGTSSLQFTAASRRQALLEQGLFYPDIGPHPGTRAPVFHNQSGAVAAVLHADRANAHSERAIPSALGRWDGLLRRIAASDAPRTLISAENASQATERAVAVFERTLPRGTHVVVTLRNHAERVASVWQQRIRSAIETRPFEDWLRSVLADKRDPSIDQRLWDRMHAEEVIGRWVAAFGQENVTIVVADKRDPLLLFTAFEDLLALPREALTPRPSEPTGANLNRSMTVEEISFARRVVEALRDEGVSAAEAIPLLHRGGFLRIQALRTPPADEARLALPAWASERAAAIGTRQAQAISALGVRVMGDLGSLGSPASPAVELPTDEPSVATDIAVHAVVGTLLAALGRDSGSGLIQR